MSTDSFDQVPLESIQRHSYEFLMRGSELPTLSDFVDRPTWMADALCREYPDVSFYPARGGSTRPAKAICAQCLVRTECLGYAIQHDEPHGIWGGTSSQDRERIRRTDEAA